MVMFDKLRAVRHYQH